MYSPQLTLTSTLLPESHSEAFLLMKTDGTIKPLPIIVGAIVRPSRRNVTCSFLQEIGLVSIENATEINSLCWRSCAIAPIDMSSNSPVATSMILTAKTLPRSGQSFQTLGATDATTTYFTTPRSLPSMNRISISTSSPGSDSDFIFSSAWDVFNLDASSSLYAW